MLFKFLTKPIVLDCFTSEPYVMDYAPIDYAIKHMPEWWRHLPTSYEDVKLSNMKKCVGMIDYYKKSVAIPLWSDLSINISKNASIEWQFADGKTNARHHPQYQYKGFLEKFTHLKIMSPWYFSSEKNINWVWSHPVYNYEHSDDTVSLPAVVNYYYQHLTHVNLFIKTFQEKQVLIKHGQPLAVLTPMSDRKVIIVRHLVDQKHIEKLNSRPIAFTNMYKKMTKSHNKFLNCPYHEE